MESVLCNTFTDFELICINDGSTDDCPSILQKYEDKDERIHVISQRNPGVSAARNLGLDVCNGKYISFIDSDDWFHPQYLELLHHAISSFSGEISMCRYLKTDSSQAVSEMTITDYNEVGFNDIDLQHILNDSAAKSYVWGKLYKREAIENIRFYPCGIAEDKLFNLYLFEELSSIKMRVIDCELYYYFQRKDSSIHRISPKRYFGILNGVYCLLMRSKGSESESMLIRESMNAAFFIRYSSHYDTNDISINKDVNEKINNLVGLLIKNKQVSAQEKCVCLIFTLLPFTYRAYRILKDRSLLSWEKNIKAKKIKGESS